MVIDTLLAKVIGTQNERELKRIVRSWPSQRPRARGPGSCPTSSCAPRPPSSAQRLANGETLDDLLPEAFAVVREAGRRMLNMRHFDVQLIGGTVLHKGKIAEMKTGEGKTLVATLPAYLNALDGKGVHVVTVNDYLARRDSEWMGRIYRFLGMTRRRHPARPERRGAAGRLRRRHHLRHQQRVRLRLPARQHEVRPRALRAARAPLRDRRRSRQHPDRRSADAADHLRARPRNRPTSTTRSTASSRGSKPGAVTRGDAKAEEREALEATGDYIVDEKHKTVTLTESGMAKAEQMLAAPAAAGRPLRSRRTCRCSTTSTRRCARTRSSSVDVDYMVKDGEVVIVDEFTGRLMPGRRWSDGLHQAVEAKEKGQDRAREPDARDRHLPELLPQVQEAVRHDRHGRHRSRGVRARSTSSTSSSSRRTGRCGRIENPTSSTAPRRKSGTRSSTTSSRSTTQGTAGARRHGLD